MAGLLMAFRVLAPAQPPRVQRQELLGVPTASRPGRGLCVVTTQGGLQQHWLQCLWPRYHAHGGGEPMRRAQRAGDCRVLAAAHGGVVLAARAEVRAVPAGSGQ